MKDLAKVAIGSKFVPARFERRSTMTYQAFRTGADSDALRLQRALLPPGTKLVANSTMTRRDWAYWFGAAFLVYFIYRSLNA